MFKYIFVIAHPYFSNPDLIHFDSHENRGLFDARKMRPRFEKRQLYRQTLSEINADSRSAPHIRALSKISFTIDYQLSHKQKI